MALTHFTFLTASADLPASFAAGGDSEGIAPTGSNQTTTAVGSAARNLCRVATDTAVYVSFGAAPNATSDDPRFFMPANSVDFFRVVVGAKGAVVTI